MTTNTIEARINNEAPAMTPALLLCFFMGPLGAHRFYLGRKGSAIAQLLLSLTVVGLVVTLPWAFIDLFLVSGMCREERKKLRQEYTIEAHGRRGVGGAG